MQFDPTRVGPVAIGVIAVLLAMSVASIGLIVERLVTTAFGLFVALPAIWAYNSFLSRIEGFRVELERSSLSAPAAPGPQLRPRAVRSQPSSRSTRNP